MRNVKFIQGITLFFLVALIVVSCSENKQTAKINTPEEVKEMKKETADIADASFIDGMTGKVFHNYLQIKDALVNSDADGVQTAAGNLAESFTEERAAMKNLAVQLSKTEDLEKQRELFFQFTKEVESLFKGSISGGTIYKQYCPMAFDNTGASWFSDISEIRNPYFGDKMLKCGKVEETIQK